MPLFSTPNFSSSSRGSTSPIPQANFADDPFQEEEEEGSSMFQSRAYFSAADAHSVANGNPTFAESAAETITNIPKFIATSLISGVNQLYNIAPTLGNAFGGNYELSKTADVVQAIDDDLGSYYKEHGESADTLGFILSSFVPGLGGMKLMNAGQKVLRTAITEGRVGNATGKALGLLAPRRDETLKKAIQAVTNTNNPFSLTERNLVRAMGAGAGQAVLEATAFEVAVAATMYKSPVLENQDLGDLVTNIAMGGLVFGAVGGLLDGTRTAFAVRRAADKADKEASPLTHMVDPIGLSPSDSIIVLNEQIHNMPAVPTTFDADRIAFLGKKAEKNKGVMREAARKEYSKLADGDEVVAQALADRAGISSAQAVTNDYFGAVSVSRLADSTPLEKQLLSIQKRVETGDLLKLSPEDLDLYRTNQISFTREWGEEVGSITMGSGPKKLHLIDTLRKGDEIRVMPKSGRVYAGKKQIVNFGKLPKAGKLVKFDNSTASVMEADARRMLLEESAPLPTGAFIHQNDLAMMRKALKEFSSTGTSIKVKDVSGEVRSFYNESELFSYIKETKEALAVKMLETAKGSGSRRVLGTPKTPHTQEEIASILDVRNSYLSGELRPNLADDLFAMESYAKDHTEMLIKKGALKEGSPTVSLDGVPQHTKMISNSTDVQHIDGNVVEAMAIIKQREVEYSSNVNRAVAANMGEVEYKKLPDASDLDAKKVSRLGAERSFIASPNGNYGSVASAVAWIGKATNSFKNKLMETARDVMEPSLYKMSQDRSGAIEFYTKMAQVAGIPDHYTLNAAGDALVPSVLKRYEDLVAAGGNPTRPRLEQADAPLHIPLNSKAAREVAAMHVSHNGTTQAGHQRLRTAQGNEHIVDTERFYPIPPAPNDYPYFATVTDETITGGSKTRTIHANTAEQLEDMINKLDGEPGLVIRTKKDAENYWDSIGQYEYEKTMHDNHIDSLLKRKGVNSPYYIPTDEHEIVDRILSFHTRKAAGLAIETVRAKYEVPFAQFKRLGEAHTNIATSKGGSASTAKHADELVENPYMDLVKTALDIKNYTDYPFWVSANKLIDEKFSKMHAKLTQTLESSATEGALAETNKILRDNGYKGAAYTMDMELLANHTAPKGVLSNYIQKANAILATVVLRLDHLNAVNNAFGANVLLGSEAMHVIRAIERGDEVAAGALAGLAKIKVPGTDKLMLSTKKLVANAIKKFGTDTPEMKFYKDNGYVTSITDQYKWTLDQMTLNGKESVKDLHSKISRVHTSLVNAANKGEKWTGNKLAEEFNRFVAADVMKQMTDIAVKHKLMDSKTAFSYINTFVNRTQGNYLASQRPMLFQGPIGQAVGLFQTYQFNLMQQLLRYVGEGAKKDYMSLLGIQGSIYGMNGMPAFNAINTHIIGTASGNKEHRDAYDTVYGAAGKDAGDWLMYGLASNILVHPDAKVNLYVRGDINPRHVTIIPTNPADVPIYGASVKFFGNLFKTADTLMSGGDVSQTLLQGLEHNGISRPLAGLAQTLQGLDNPEHSSYSTSKRGNVIAANDLMSLANMSRMVGGKPLAEAVAVDAMFRLRTYAAADQQKRNELGADIKTTMIAGQIPSQEQVDDFASSYVGVGGKQKEFNKWMLQLYKTANTSQVNELQSKLNSPFAKSMQSLMGGEELGDFNDE